MSICPPGLAPASPGGAALDRAAGEAPALLLLAGGPAGAGGANAAAAGLATRPGLGEPVAGTPGAGEASWGDPSPELSRGAAVAAAELEPGAGPALVRAGGA